jgi:peptidoglycan-associated lipoprotein
MKFRSVLVPTATLALTLFAALAASCGGEQQALPAAAPTPPAADNGKIERVAPTVAVSEDLVLACKLRLADNASSPRFDFDRAELSEADRAVLAKLASCLTTGPLRGRSLQLTGRTDPRGEPQYNMVLGASRASGVADALASLGLDRGHVATTSRGELDATGTDEPSYRDDRRVDITLAQ